MVDPRTIAKPAFPGKRDARNVRAAGPQTAGQPANRLPVSYLQPRRALSELLLRQPGIGEIRLLSPCLTAIQRSGRLVMLFDPPATLSAWALAQLGFDVEQLLLINTRTAQLPPGRPEAVARPLGGRARSDRGLSSEALPSGDSLWALEQALKSGHVGAVLAWLLPRLRAERLRRL